MRMAKSGRAHKAQWERCIVQHGRTPRVIICYGSQGWVRQGLTHFLFLRGRTPRLAHHSKDLLRTAFVLESSILEAPPLEEHSTHCAFTSMYVRYICLHACATTTTTTTTSTTTTKTTTTTTTKATATTRTTATATTASVISSQRPQDKDTEISG